MRLYELLEDYAQTSLADCEVTGLTDDSRKVQPGMIFACIRGAKFDGHSVAEKMLEQGAVAVLVDHDLGLGEKQILTQDTRTLYGQLCAAWFGHPEQKMHFIGVTGTNGKTTTTTLIKQILTKNGHKVGLIGTIQNEIGDEIVHTDNTTPFVYDLMALYAKMAEAGCDYVVMEVSSFGLVQQRIGTTHFDVAAFTNLTQDHLDYHGNMENYYQAKKLLFSLCDHAVIDVDDSYGKRLAREISCAISTYGVGEGAMYRTKDIALHADGTDYSIATAEQSFPVHLNLTGGFNVANATAAYLICLAAGLSHEAVLTTLEQCPGVRGRCEVIPTGRDFTMICDYAHTPDAVENILKSVKEYTEGRLICLFGCGGNRDNTKRPKMAKAAAQYADYLVVTSDNPRDEDPQAIIDEILTGLAGSDVPYTVVIDRKEAILKSMQMAQPGDVIVLAGKGHEDYQILANGVHIHMDEREIVQECLPLVPKR